MGRHAHELYQPASYTPAGPLDQAYFPLGRDDTVEEVADYVVFLSIPSAIYIKGTGRIID